MNKPPLTSQPEPTPKSEEEIGQLITSLTGKPKKKKKTISTRKQKNEEENMKRKTTTERQLNP